MVSTFPNLGNCVIPRNPCYSRSNIKIEDYLCNSFKMSINIIDIMESGLTDLPEHDIETSTAISNLETTMESLQSLESEMTEGESL